ncbi:ABC transporter ATP-binding protein [Candidatus Woesearchaeota archaeon]|nr:ABC transporter ATP-binding protein [Candidatus Woesearchaeota archaeon]
MDDQIIRFENIVKKFGHHMVLNKIDLSIYDGEIFGIIGPSGSGKTTFLKTLIGYYLPEEGDVLFRPNTRFLSVYKNIKKVKQTFGYGAQQPSFYPELTVSENLDYFGSLYDMPSEPRKTNIKTLLKLMELDGSANELAKNLSGGMQRRLDIACALIHAPKILILDEPTSDLDPALAKHIWSLIRKINNKGTTIIIASHHISDMENTCTRVGILAKGKILHVGRVQELIKKFSKGYEIHIETYPGDYSRIIKSFKEKLVISTEDRGHEAVFYTTKPEAVLHKLLHLVGDVNETLIDVRISKLNLDNIFLSLIQK